MNYIFLGFRFNPTSTNMLCSKRAITILEILCDGCEWMKLKPEFTTGMLVLEDWTPFLEKYTEILFAYKAPIDDNDANAKRHAFRIKMKHKLYVKILESLSEINHEALCAVNTNTCINIRI